MVVQWVEVESCTSTRRKDYVRQPPVTSSTIHQRLHLSRNGKLPSASTTTLFVILPQRFFIFHQNNNLPSLSTTIYYIIFTATIYLLPVQQISADVNKDLQRSFLHTDSLFTARTADLQKRQRSSTFFTTTI